MGGFSDLFFNSKFARRIFLIFVIAAAIPVTVVALLSLDHVSAQLRDQSHEQSRQTSKSVGMELFRRLSMAADELEQVARQLGPDPVEQHQSLQTLVDTQLRYLTELAVVEHGGSTSTLRTVFDQLPEFSVTQRQALVAGKTVLQARRVNEQLTQILMARSLDTQTLEHGVLIGEVSQEFLWAVRSMLPSSTEVTILTSDNVIAYNSGLSEESLTSTIKPLLSDSISGHFNLTIDNSTYLASYWSVFTESTFSMPYLLIVASQPEDEVLAPITDFRNIYSPALILAVLIMSFVAAGQIRKRLTPLVVLRDATQSIASGDFSRKISISTDDEFAQLAAAFNAMAGKLEKQFTSLSTMAEIDRLILSSFDTQYIIETVLDRASELTPCAVVAMLEIEDARINTGRLSVRANTSLTETSGTHVRLSPEEIEVLGDKPGSVLINSETAIPSFLESLSGDGNVCTFLLFPMFVKQRLAAVLIMGYAKQHTRNGFNEGQLCKLADHVAVALSNASWEERLYHQAHYDTLTNLPNRALLKDRLEQAIARAQRNQTYVGVIFIDLDRFKLVNDSLGHDIGDKLLNNTAQLLVNTVRNVDTVVRFGGDEFVIIIPDITRKGDVVSELGGVADKVIATTTGEFDIDNHMVYSGMSIGIALYPKDGKTSDELVKNADTAMYHAKEQGRDRYEFFAPELNEAAILRLNLEQELHRALRNGEFVIHYQSKVDCLSGKLVGVEALIRWNHPQKGFVQPSEFISIAEEAGLILKIGDWVLNTVCRQMTAWHEAGLPAIRMAVNVSPRQFREPDFPVRVAEILKTTQLDPKLLELEVTEGSVMENIDDAIGKLDILNTMGIHLSVDDFGTGYSSLSYLIKLPIHSLKIDQSFILNMVNDQNTQAIVSSTIYLAHQLGLGVVAEGVETHEQRELLQNWRCDILQGYLVGKPVTSDQFRALLAQNTGNVKPLIPKAQGY